MPHCGHLLLQPANPSPLQDTPAYFEAADFLTVASLTTSGQQITQGEKKKHNPYLELENENILSLTLSQAPTFVCFYICTQRPKSLFFVFFFFFPPSSVRRCQVFIASRHTHTHSAIRTHKVQEGYFTSKIRTKQRLKSSHCVKDGNRQWGRSDRSTAEMSDVE